MKEIEFAILDYLDKHEGDCNVDLAKGIYNLLKGIL